MAEPKSYVVITEAHGDLFTVWLTCLRNDSAGLTCPHALTCHCERHASGPTLMVECHSYDTWAAALACADALNEPLLFDAQGRRVPALQRTDPPASRGGSQGDGYCFPTTDGGIDADIPF